MKKQLLAGVAVLLGAGFAGMAAAQSGPGVWPQVGLIDLEACRPIISKVHAIEKLEIRKLIADRCGADPRKFARSGCKEARRWLGNTQAKDHVVWYFEGNDSCSTSNYPCFGVSNYNRPRGGEDAKRWVQFFREKAALTPMVTQGMDLRTGVREADRCVARIWADKYDQANPPRKEPPPASAPLLASAAAGAKLVEETTAATTATTTTAAAAPATAMSAPTATASAAVTDVATGALATAATAAIAAAVESAAAVAPVLIADVQQTPPATTAATTTTEQGAGATTTTAVSPPTAVATAAPAGAATTAAPAPGSAATATAAVAAPVVPAVAEPVELAGAPENPRLAACRAGVAAKGDLDKALIACFSTGATDGEVLTLRGQIHLLAGRYQDAWNDFNIAWTDYQANVALFLRGLASAGLGRTAGALRDMAQAEEAQAGLLESWASQGYSLAGAMTRKPLAPDAPVDAPVVAAKPAPAPAPVAPPPPPPAVTVDQAPGKPVEISAVPAALAVVAGVVAAAPLPPPAAIKEAPITPPMDVPEDAPLKKADAPVPTKAAYDANLPADDPRKTATDCLEPLQQGDAGNPAPDDVFRNKCDYAVRLVYCNVPKMSSGLSLPFACGSTTGLMVHLVAANSLQPARLGKEVAYFGCRSGARPDVEYSAEQGLFGYCR